MHHLDRGIWPLTTARSEQGALHVGGLDVRDLAQQYGTPLFVLDEADFKARAAEYSSAFDGDVYYAAKSFLCSAVARWVHEAGLRIDVCTGGELACALQSGIPASDILFHGNNKSKDELRQALSAGVARIVVDSFDELARVGFLADELGTEAGVLIRLTVGVEAHTHEFIATAHEDQKFGFSIASGDAEEAVRRALEMPRVTLIGVHSHIGSQIFSPDGFEVAAHRVIKFLARVRDQFDVEVDELNLGGGLGIRYVEDDSPLDVTSTAATLHRIVEQECRRVGLTTPRVAFEPGRAISGPSTITVYEVGTIKEVALDGDETRTYVSVDGGMSDNIRTALYDAEYTVVLASRASDATPMRCRVVGKHCESGDVVVKDCELPADLSVGDLIAVAATGAYNRSMASNYNMVPRPGVVAVSEGDSRLVLRPETLDDLLALDPGLSS